MKTLDDLFRDIGLRDAGFGTTATTGMLDSNLSADGLKIILENFRRVMQAHPAPPKLLIRENPFMSSTDIIRVTVKLYRLSSKGCRRKWVCRGEIFTVFRTVPTTKAYQLADGSIVCHPTVADRIRKTINPEEIKTWPMK